MIEGSRRRSAAPQREGIGDRPAGQGSHRGEEGTRRRDLISNA